MAIMEQTFDFDPFDPVHWDDPYPHYEVLRDHHPVYRHRTPFGRVWPHYWMLSRAEDVRNALADWRTFSSDEGVLVDTGSPGGASTEGLLFDADPPRHDEIRSLLVRVLTPPRIGSLEPHVRDYATEIVDEVGPLGRFDASTDFGQLIPTITMCALLDLPRSERSQFLKWNLDTLGGNDFQSEQAQAAWAEMNAYWVDIVRERRKRPGPDLISLILQAQDEGSVPISDEEVSSMCGLLHDASQNTTMNMISLTVMALSQFPEQRRRLAADPSLWPRAIDELLRWVSPVQGLARCTTRDVTLHDVTIPAGDQVLMLFGSANHDPRFVDRPDDLDFGREPKVNFAFGHGIHHCVGNAVAKLEVRVAVQVLLERLGDWEVDMAAVERSQLVPTRGVAHAPTSFAPTS